MCEDYISFIIGKLHTEEALETLLKMPDICYGGAAAIMLNFEFDAPESQQMYIYDRLVSAGAHTKKLIINGMVPRIDNIPYLEKLAEGCHTVLLRGYFDPRTLSEVCLSELVIVTKYLLGTTSCNWGIATDTAGVYYQPTHIAENEQVYILRRAFEKAFIKKEHAERLLNNRWVSTQD